MAQTKGDGSASASTLFNRSVDPIKKIPSVNFDAVTVGDTPVTVEAWLEAAFFPFLPATISFSGDGPQEDGLTANNITLNGSVVANDEDGFSTFVLKDGSSAVVDTFTVPTGPDVTTNWSSVQDVTSNETYTVSVGVDNNGSSATITAPNALAFYYPTYYHAGAAGLLEAAIKGGTKSVETSRTSSHSYTVVGGHFYLAYPQSFGALVEILNPSNLDVLPSMTRTTPTWTAADTTSVPYYVYEWTSATTQTGYLLRFS
jgi:hypothetical protein